jgi:ribosomal protein S18 acetylase RimI-like enzyme
MIALLDNVIWNALTTEQSHFGERDGDAARFAPEVTALAGLREATPEAFAGLARLLGDGAAAGLFLDAGVELPPALTYLDGATVVQMVHVGPTPDADETGLIELGADYNDEMIDLAHRTRPGPFGTRTRELGAFLGVQSGGRLVAMAGQRMRLPGLIEVSAVCTDPGHLGRGYAGRLMNAQIARIRAAGATPFLHVRGDNDRAVGVYERLGFASRRSFRYAIVRATAA